MSRFHARISPALYAWVNAVRSGPEISDDTCAGPELFLLLVIVWLPSSVFLGAAADPDADQSSTASGKSLRGRIKAPVMRAVRAISTLPISVRRSLVNIRSLDVFSSRFADCHESRAICVSAWQNPLD